MTLSIIFGDIVFRITQLGVGRKELQIREEICWPKNLHRYYGICAIGPKSLYLATPLVFKSPGGGFPSDDLREIFSGCQWMANVPNAVEILPTIWTAQV